MSTITLAVIKPDAIKNKQVGKIIQMIEENGFSIEYIKRIELTKEGAEGFYEEHRNKDFFTDLVQFMASGPIFILVLRKKNAIVKWRKLMDKIRKKYQGKRPYENAVHGSDSQASLVREVEYMYKVTKERK